jgi:ACS family hexuronate transporter-like MFS transporter
MKEQTISADQAALPAQSVSVGAALNSRIGHYRWVICGLLFFATTINYVDRQVLGILSKDLQVALGWNELQYGNIVAAFNAAYALGLLGAGRLMDRFGTKIGYSLALVIWSVAAMGHALAQSAFGFGIARAALGLGEAGNFPAAIKTVAEWFPKKERALATGIFNSGSNVGAIVAPLAVPTSLRTMVGNGLLLLPALLVWCGWLSGYRYMHGRSYTRGSAKRNLLTSRVIRRIRRQPGFPGCS